MIYSFNNKEYPIEIIKKNNKNTYIRVRKGTIIVTTNYFVTPKQIDNLITSNKDAINKMIMQDSKKQSKEEDNKFYLFGKYYDIKFDKEIKETVVQDNLMI